MSRHSRFTKPRIIRHNSDPDCGTSTRVLTISGCITVLQSGRAQERLTSSSLFVVTHVDVPPPRKDETEALLTKVAEQIRSNEGNLRFDVFQQNAPRLNHFTIISVWNDERAFALHEANAQTRLFREALGPMLGALYDERIYRQIP